MSAESRIDRRFAALKQEGRAAFGAFVTAGDPDYATSEKILHGLPAAGADIIELGMPFSDPMADGPAVQASSLRALKSGQTMKKTLELVRGFRAKDPDTPIVLMGYYNPIYIYPGERFLDEAKAAGVDGLIIVDLPPEADDGALPAGHRPRPQLHPPRHADHGRQAAAGRPRQYVGLPLLCFHHRHHRHRGARCCRRPCPHRPHQDGDPAARRRRLRHLDARPGQGDCGRRRWGGGGLSAG